MKILVTGAGGGLGHELRPVFGDHDLLLYPRADLDVTSEDAVTTLITETEPDAIIHAAAFTDVDGAEAQPAEALLLNHQSTGYVAKAAAKVGAKLVYPSTDYVFDGHKGEPYVEDDFAEPLSVYGQSKLKGETLALSENYRTYVVRTSWLYSHVGKSFVSTMLKLFGEHSELKVVRDEISSPTYSRDFARAVHQLLEDDREEYGIYHASSEEAASWYDFAEAIAGHVQADIKLTPITAAEWGATAARPKYSKLDTSKLRKLGITMPDWKQGLANYFQDAA